MTNTKTYKSGPVNIYFKSKTLAAVDETRGLIPRSTYVADILNKALGVEE